MKNDVLWEGDTAFEHYQVTDTVYDGRPARVLYSGDRRAAQSGLAQDTESDLLFDYNQRLFELVTNLDPTRLLLIGGGVGTLPTALLAALPTISIDVVELDSGLTDLAYRYFDLPKDDRLRVFHTDGRLYLEETRETYDVIVVDAFNHTAIPHNIKTFEAFQAYNKHLTSGGILAMNIISGYYGPSAKILKEVCAASTQFFSDVDVFLASRGYSLWLPQNFVLAAQKGISLPLQAYVRHAAVNPIIARKADILHDE